MIKTLGERVTELREEVGLSQADLADIVGMTQQGIAAIETGKSSHPRKLREIARALRTSVENLLGEENESRPSHGNDRAIPSSGRDTGGKNQQIWETTYSGLTNIKRMTDSHTPVVGKVAAGVWLEVEQMDGGVPFEFLPIPMDSSYPKGSVYGLEVEGTSLNLVAKPGDILVCVDLYKARDVDINDGALVIVQRTRDGGALKEVTAKRVRKEAGRYLLLPESDDPRWQTPIEIPDGIGDGSEEVSVIARVLWIYRKP